MVCYSTSRHGFACAISCALVLFSALWRAFKCSETCQLRTLIESRDLKMALFVPVTRDMAMDFETVSALSVLVQCAEVSRLVKSFWNGSLEDLHFS